MKILILIEIASLGGHAISALTTGQELSKRGHDVIFAGGDGPLKEMICNFFSWTKLDYFYFHGQRQTYFTWKSLSTLKGLLTIVDSTEIDHIHAFDARSYILATFVGILRKIPVTCTLCGGITPYYNVPRCGKVIVFSEEQRKKFIETYGWNGNNIEVNSARLDMLQFSQVDNAEVEDTLQKHGIDSKNRNVMMITNFLGPKVKAIRHVLEAAPIVLKEFTDANLVIVGEKGAFYSEAIRIGERINRDLRRRGVIFTGAIMNAQRLLKVAYVVLGVGRSAFEGMAYQKPTLIVGENGYAGTVTKENIDDIWFYNFSGRNNLSPEPIESLTSELIRLLQNRNYYDRVRNIGLQFLRDHIDIKSGISQIEKIYEENKNYAQKANSGFRFFDMGKVLFPILRDNYYNSLKFIMISLVNRKRKMSESS